jgi:hypothetical protein
VLAQRGLLVGALLCLISFLTLTALVTHICAALVSIVAYSRMYLDAHWLSDILGGLSIGLAYLLLVICVIGPTPPLSQTLGLPARGMAEGLPVVAATGESTAETLLGTAGEPGKGGGPGSGLIDHSYKVPHDFTPPREHPADDGHSSASTGTTTIASAPIVRMRTNSSTTRSG